MKKISIILFFIGIISCKQQEHKKEKVTFTKTIETIEEDYELYKPEETKAVIILFGGYFETTKDIKTEFNILDIAIKNNIAVLFSSFNQKLWLQKKEKHQLAKRLQNIIIEHKLPAHDIYIGGFSSGGNVSLLISNFIVGMKQFYIDPKGIFIIDSPIDLLGLYKSSEKNIKHNFSKTSTQESTWLLKHLSNNLGNPTNSIKEYENKSVFTYSTNNISSLKKLKNTKIRFYTEPDTLWWKQNRMIDYKNTNAFHIEKLTKTLVANQYKDIEYIPTTNKGYRANGKRHPHSWSIVDKEDLIKWMLQND